MWFKQIQLFQLTNVAQYKEEDFTEKLTSLAFTPCLPSMPSGMGWVAPCDGADTHKLLRTVNGYTMLCLQIEEKILPAAVVNQELAKKVQHIENSEQRKIRQKEKLSLKDEIIMTLLPRAFSKVSKIYGYIDNKNCRLVLGSANAKRAEQFISMFKKSISEEVCALNINKLAPVITQWLKRQDHTASFAIEKSCMLQDPKQQSRVIRCQQQDLFASSIQSLIKDDCEVKQLALSWQDRVSFVLSDTLALQGIKFQDEIVSQATEMEPETKQQQFDADFFIMTETLSNLLQDLLHFFGDGAVVSETS